jgi:hypothetical protein
MPVPFHYYNAVANCPKPEWTNFINAMSAKVSLLPKQDELIAVMTAELNKYGATTNWRDLTDPIWFPDQERLIEWVLAWS